MFGRKSIVELVREDREAFWEVVRDEWRTDQRAEREEMREFMRELLLRNEKVYTRVIAEMEEGRKQIAANTRAVLSVLARLEGGAGA